MRPESHEALDGCQVIEIASGRHLHVGMQRIEISAGVKVASRNESCVGSEWQKRQKECWPQNPCVIMWAVSKAMPMYGKLIHGEADCQLILISAWKPLSTRDWAKQRHITQRVTRSYFWPFKAPALAEGKDLAPKTTVVSPPPNQARRLGEKVPKKESMTATVKPPGTAECLTPEELPLRRQVVYQSFFHFLHRLPLSPPGHNLQSSCPSLFVDVLGLTCDKASARLLQLQWNSFLQASRLHRVFWYSPEIPGCKLYHIY